MVKKVLIFYTSAVGQGHKRSAEAIKLTFNRLYPSYEIILVDSLSTINKTFNNIISFFYKLILKYTPSIWRLIYSNEKQMSKFRFMSYIFSFRFKKIIKENNPGVVICTQAFPCIILSHIKENFKLVAVLTDFNVHKWWVNKNIDLFTVPTEETKSELINSGIDGDKIKVTGIPIKKIKYKEKPNNNILILGGGAGLLNYKEIMRVIPQKYNLSVVLGNNKEVNLESKNVKQYSYVENIEKLYASSKIVITKPGGLTLSELIFINKPMILVNPLPGQEQKNADYLLKNHAALRAYNINEIPSLIKKLEERKFLNEIKNNLRKISKPNASENIVRLLVGF